MPLSHIDRFALEYFTLNSISERRQQYVLRSLARLDAFLDMPLIEATDNDLRSWLVDLLDDGLKPSTVAWHLKMVLPFYQWCWQQRIIDADALMRIRGVSPPRGYNTALPRPYSRKEIAQMWDELDAAFPYTSELMLRRWRNGTSPYRGQLKRHVMRLQLDAILELALICGLRKNEIYRLTADDVHWDNKYIVVHGKRVDQNDKVREVPYPDSTRDAIKAWFRIRAQLGPEPGVCLWLSVTGPSPAAPLSEKRMNSILHSFGDWTLHRMRHTCATERLRAKMELERLQRFLGHATIQQTLVYAQLVRGDIHKSAERTDVDFQRAIGRKRVA